MWEQTEGKGSDGISSQSQYEKGHGKAQIPPQSYTKSALLCLSEHRCSSLTSAHQAREMVQCSRVVCSSRGSDFNSQHPYQEAHNRLLFQVQEMQHSLLSSSGIAFECTLTYIDTHTYT